MNRSPSKNINVTRSGIKETGVRTTDHKVLKKNFAQPEEEDPVVEPVKKSDPPKTDPPKKTPKKDDK